MEDTRGLIYLLRPRAYFSPVLVAIGMVLGWLLYVRVGPTDHEDARGYCVLLQY